MPTTTELVRPARLTKFACRSFNGRLETTGDGGAVVEYGRRSLSKGELDSWEFPEEYGRRSRSRIGLDSSSETRSTASGSEISSSEEITISSGSSLESSKVIG